jgi:hypothetical protein
MKTSVATTLLSGALLAGALTASAPAEAFDWGARGGLNLADLGGADAPDGGIRTGFNIGVMGVQNLMGPKFRLSLEGSYSQQGNVLDIPTPADATVDSTFTGDVRLNLAYINVDAILRFDIPIGPRWPKFYALGGAQVGFLLAQSITNEDGEKGEPDDLGSDFEFNRLHVGFVLGAGARMRLAGLDAFFELRYNRDIPTIAKRDSDAIVNSVTMLILGVHM